MVEVPARLPDLQGLIQADLHSQALSYHQFHFRSEKAMAAASLFPGLVQSHTGMTKNPHQQARILLIVIDEKNA